ncbi:hypothetical protein EZV62_008521 [Acer yangbiense]|uniref:non-specific serine/threonine protein kinase n=1 Tax=Acer yangbiense TaxID=1000413 RepID=A0A5C7IFM4_9ROSI|nr:hypothetical protein EZV62_008521 [Acer yangbiense]
MFVVYSILFFILGTSAVLDTITPSQSIKDGETLLSAGGTFELVFPINYAYNVITTFEFPGNSTRRYLGIWYKVVFAKTVAWVADRETSLTDHSGVLNVTQQGILVLLDGMNRRIWSSNTSRTSSALGVRKSCHQNYLWQSFDHPTDTLLPGMKLGRNFVTGLDKNLSSWKSLEHPAPGQFSQWIDPHGLPQLMSSTLLLTLHLILGMMIDCNCLLLAGFTMLIIYFFLLSYITITTTLSLDTITLGQSIKDGEKLVSAGNVFELGFFRPGKSSGQYLGIWYKKDGEKSAEDTVAWVANRNNPISDSSGFLSINAQGSLVLRMNSTNNIVWSSSNASTSLLNPVAVLLESGNLVVKDGNNNFLWQSFDYPCNTFLPGMKMGRNLVTGMEWFLSSWKSIDDPAPGDFTFQVDPHGFPQLFVKKGPKILYRAGSWNGLRWTGTPYLGTNSVYTYEFVSNETGLFYTFDIPNISVPERWVMSSSGYLLPSKWKDQNWERFSVTEVDRCELYDVCGSYASCNINNLPDLCECLEGFTPKSPGHGTEGCVRRAPLHCNHSDGFLIHKEVKLPDTSHSRVDNNISLAECKEFCLNNCSCTAYANSDVREGRTGCLLWFGDLFDIKKLELNGQDLYVRVAASELANIDQPIARRRHLSEKKRAIILVSCVVSAVGVLVLGWVIFMGKRKLRIQDSITPSQSIKDGETLDSGGNFELAFFSPGNSTRRYLGIQYKVVKTVAWVANRETSLTDHSGVLNVTQQGNLVLLDGMNRIIWSSNTSRTAKNPVVQLLKSGNLVVKDGNDDDPGNFLWQSFDLPTDTLLPGMKLGRNFVTGLDTYLSSWKSSEDPAPGQFSLWIDPHGFPQLVLRNGSALCYRAGSWNVIRFTGTLRLNPKPEFLYRFELNKDEQGSLMSRLFLSQPGLIQLLVRSNQSKVWTTVYDAPEDQCDIYSFCGAQAACKTDSSSSVCVCLDGFEPKSPEEWRMSNWSKGCVRMTELNCEKGDEFRNYTGLKLPDTSNSTFNTSMSLQECKEKCLKDCSCTAYANSNISQEGSGCLLWFGNLTDIRLYDQGGQNFYIRMAAIEKGSTIHIHDGNSTVKKRIGIIVGSVILIAMLLVGLIFYIHRRKHKKQGNFVTQSSICEELVKLVG